VTRGIGCLLVCHLNQVSLMYPVPIAPIDASYFAASAGKTVTARHSPFCGSSNS
jgi:hypothetical protein